LNQLPKRELRLGPDCAGNLLDSNIPTSGDVPLTEEKLDQLAAEA